MPVETEVITAQVQDIERLNQQQPLPLKDMLDRVQDTLIHIRTLFIVFDLIDRLSRKRLPWREKFGELSTLLDRLRPLVDPHIKNKEYSLIIKYIIPLLPPKDEEASYIEKIIATDDAINRRAYVPQAFVCIGDIAKLGTEINEIAFMATHGIGPCVGYILFSKTAGRCALAHFDDPYGVTTDLEALPAITAKAKGHYISCVQKILDQAKAVSVDLAAEDWHVILLPSTNSQSGNLQELLKEAVEAINVKCSVSSPKAREGIRSVLIELAPLISTPSQLIVRRYEEKVPFADLPPNLLTLKEALHLPKAGFGLYKIEEGTLVPQDIDALYSIVNNFVTSRPLEPPSVAEVVATVAGEAAVDMVATEEASVINAAGTAGVSSNGGVPATIADGEDVFAKPGEGVAVVMAERKAMEAREGIATGEAIAINAADAEASGGIIAAAAVVEGIVARPDEEIAAKVEERETVKIGDKVVHLLLLKKLAFLLG